MKEDTPPSTFDPSTILSGMTGNGKFRAVFIAGPSNQNKAKKLAELGTAIVRTEPKTFCAFMDASKATSPYEWCSQFARTLRTMSGAEPMALAKFAMAVGKSLIPFKPGGSESTPEKEANKKVVASLVQHFDELVNHLPKEKNSPKLVIIMDKFEALKEEMLEWLSTVLNEGLRNSKSFDASRFIFSASQKSPHIVSFFDRFGFDRVHEFILGGLDNPTISMQTGQPDTEVAIEPDSTAPRKLLKSSTPSPSLLGRETTDMDSKLEEAKKFFGELDEVHQKFIVLGSYANSFNRYTLEFFADSREAALCFNWLSKQPDLCDSLQGGQVTVKQEVKDLARIFHAASDPAKAEKWSTLSSVLDAFNRHFPAQSSHWIPINLQLLTWFDSRLLERLFDQDQVSEILAFINAENSQFDCENNRYSLSADPKMVTKRLLELSHLEPFPGIAERVRELWALDLEKTQRKRSRMEAEKKNFLQDVASTVSEIESLGSIKEKLLNDFSASGKSKAEKILSFSSSKLLIFIGLGTVGISLMSENLGSYHAACGLAVALFGFFWPSVDIKRSSESLAIASSPLSLEAQQRSLEHRVANLNNRLKVMQSNLSEVEEQIAKLGESWDEPYIDIEEA